MGVLIVATYAALWAGIVTSRIVEAGALLSSPIFAIPAAVFILALHYAIGAALRRKTAPLICLLPTPPPLLPARGAPPAPDIPRYPLLLCAGLAFIAMPIAAVGVAAGAWTRRARAKA